MYTSLVSYIFIYLQFLGCGQYRPMQGIWPRHGRFDLRIKNGKTSCNTFEFVLLAVTFLFLVEMRNLQKLEIPNRRLYPTNGRFWTNGRLCPINGRLHLTKTQSFGDAWLPIGLGTYSSWDPSKARFNHVNELLQLQQRGVWQLRIHDHEILGAKQKLYRGIVWARQVTY